MTHNQDVLARIDRHIHDNVDYWLGQLARLCAQPSVSAQNDGITECAALVATMLAEQGFRAEIMPSAGYPVVYGEGDGAGDKTLLFYLHYDVQPAEPLALWESPPFEMTRRGDTFYARGISDDKGHIIARLAALAAVKEALGELPVNVKFIIEGEEEIGSPHMPAFVEAHQEKLAADACIWEFGSVDYDGAPTQTLGMRGICYVELSVQSAGRDIHSGFGGSIMPNAAWRLVWALNTLKDEDERILIPGFYDNVAPPSERDLALLARLPDHAAQVQADYGLAGFLKGLTGGLEWKQTAVFQPTCTICGLTS
ncbi:MAG: M20/M25/M40 family metallo-hydrolase, partial [Anaerolineales bacterium]|nr:M20/M25/M40 family metallo-hydrolase [Anaerolineales bacterium]